MSKSEAANTLMKAWKDLKAKHGLEQTAAYIVDYYKEVGVVFPSSWDQIQCQQLITAFMETLKVEEGKVVNEVTLMGETTPAEVDEVFTALAHSRPVMIPEHMLVAPRKKMTFTQMRKLSKRK